MSMSCVISPNGSEPELEPCTEMSVIVGCGNPVGSPEKYVLMSLMS